MKYTKSNLNEKTKCTNLVSSLLESSVGAVSSSDSCEWKNKIVED
jgi:hypothetical protein